MIPDDAVGVLKIDLPSVLEKAQIKNGEKVALPDDLKKVIDEVDANVFNDIVSNMPSSGIDMKSHCYVYFSTGIYKSVALFHLEDEEAAMSMLEKIAGSGSKMKEISGIDFISHSDTTCGFAIDDDIMIIGHYNTPVTDEVASREAKNIFDKSRPSLLENKEVATSIDVDKCDVAAYFDIKGMLSIYKDDLKFNTSFGDLNMFDLLAGLDIKALKASINFDTSSKDNICAKITTDFLFDQKSQYSMLYDQVISSAENKNGEKAFEMVPGDPEEFDTYFGIKLYGAKLGQTPLVKAVFETPSLFLSGILGDANYKDILDGINGTFAFGIGAGHIEGFNFGVGVQSTNPDVIVDEIVREGERRGQGPEEKSNGEYIYEHGSQAIVLGQNEGVVYLRCVDFETRFSAAESWPILIDELKRSSVVFFKNLQIDDKDEGQLCWGLRNKSHGEGIYYAQDENANIVISLLKILCWSESEKEAELGVG